MSLPQERNDGKPQYPAYSEILGPEQDILIMAAGKDYVAHPELVYITCENGWVDLDEWR